jgi:recombinational DNA repair protein RecT
MTVDEALEHGRKHSKTFNKKTNQFRSSSPWLKEQNAMCLKTVLIQLFKLLPISIELQSVISVDETSRTYKQGTESFLELPDDTNWQDEVERLELKEPRKLEGTDNEHKIQ